MPFSGVKDTKDRRGWQSTFIMKNYKVKRLTRQYNGYDKFKYLVEPDGVNEIANRQQLAEWRNWCWATWGASRELLWAITGIPNAQWAWQTEFKHKRIYLKSDAELVLFELKF